MGDDNKELESRVRVSETKLAVVESKIDNLTNRQTEDREERKEAHEETMAAIQSITSRLDKIEPQPPTSYRKVGAYAATGTFGVGTVLYIILELFNSMRTEEPVQLPVPHDTMPAHHQAQPDTAPQK